ncbi:MAG: flagellar assembly protein T N-terminal domain-containing protein [Candidatus Aegiribacteria sp.]|nr:flagellar assembly protein T N-terminal domain-containing protein [Candidatus Aegiribacteria sp.]
MKWITLISICLATGCNQQIVIPAASSGSDSVSSVSSATTTELQASGANDIEILAEGVAALGFAGGLDIARDHALDDALRKAIEQGVGVYIDAETEVNNFQLISDEIYSKARGYVSSYRIINEEQDGDLYRVVIRAVVNTDGIENDLAAIGILLHEQGRPRVMVIVKELASMADLSDESSLMSSIMFETMLLDHFRQQGFPVVDASTVADILERDQLKLILEGDDQTAALIGLSAGAEIVITGTALHTVNSRMIAGSTRDIHEFQVSSRAINTQTGSVLAGTAITAEVPFSESQARTRAADSTSSQLISAILNGWVQGENITVIVAANADFERVQALRSELRLKLRGVLDVITRDLTGSRATLEVVSETGTTEIIDELVSSEIDVNFEVTGMSGNRIEIRFTD